MELEEIDIPIYGGKLVIMFCDNWSALKTVYESAIGDYELDDNCDGYVFQHDLQFVVAFNRVPKGSVIAHETVHLVNKLYRDRSMELCCRNDEHQAYLTEWFFGEIENFFKKI